MKYRYVGNPSFVVGFHGCDREVAERVLAGDGDLISSENTYDWLGHGIYFWENNLERAKAWAEHRANDSRSSVKEPAAVGAMIDLSLCLSLLQADHIGVVRETYETLREFSEKTGKALPENRGGDDAVIRNLDCSVIQLVHKIRSERDEPPFDTVRGLFPEGSELYPNAGFRTENHIQICVRNRECIKGYFRPIEQ